MKAALHTLLADGKTKRVIAQLRDLTADDPDLHNEVLQLSAQFVENERQTRLNAGDPRLLATERNRLNAALLSVTERLSDPCPIEAAQTKLGKNSPLVWHHSRISRHYRLHDEGFFQKRKRTGPAHAAP